MSDVHPQVAETTSHTIEPQESQGSPGLDIQPESASKSTEEAVIEQLSKPPHIVTLENSPPTEMAIATPLEQSVKQGPAQVQNKIVPTISDEFDELDPLERSTEFMLDSAEGSTDMNNLPPVLCGDLGFASFAGRGGQPLLQNQHKHLTVGQASKGPHRGKVQVRHVPNRSGQRGK